MNNIQEFSNESLGLKVRCVKSKDGSISMSLEDTAIGFGWTKKANSGNMVIRWDRVSKFLKEFGVPTCGHDDFITESLFYLLGMKASNDTAKKFQIWLATEVLPSIRKHGAYISEDADEEYVQNELRFSQKRTIKTFSTTKVSELEDLYAEFKSYVDKEYKYKSKDRIARYKSVEKGLECNLVSLATDVKNIGKCYDIRQLKEQVILDRTKIEKKKLGGDKSSKTRKIKDLQLKVI